MPTIDHEMPLEMVRNRPALVPELLRTMFDFDIAETSKSFLGSEALNDCDPREYRCDAAVMLGDPEKPSLGVIVEVQSRPSKRKRYTWPAYMAGMRARKECDVVLLVLCPDKTTAARCAEPIETGHPGWILTPLVINLADISPITDVDRARRLPELAVLGALLMTGGPETRPVLHAFCAALTALPRDIGGKYYDHVESRLPAEARSILREIMKTENYELQSEFALHYAAIGKAEGKAQGWAEGRAEGRAEGKAEGAAEGEARSILKVMAGRGLEPSDEERARIQSCTDKEQLDIWLDRAISAATVAEVFD
ncbi:hypothetical protein [Spirillospora sp. NPDC029432]|uniref:hypothetical protein n=1 Tax=Spirillospora sp. NPDC029432 TaxID=3154599 RepID=UPI003456696F